MTDTHGNERRATLRGAHVLQELDQLTFGQSLLYWAELHPGARRAALNAQSSLKLPLDQWKGAAAPDWPEIRRSLRPDGREELGLQLTVPRWHLYPRLQAGSLAWTAQRGAGGEAWSLVALAARLRADLHPLLPPVERHGMHELLAASGWSDALIREEELSQAKESSGTLDDLGRSDFPEPIDLPPQARLGGALVMARNLEGETLTLITPCGEALRRSLAEEAGLTLGPRGLRRVTRWAHDAPVPSVNIEVDTCAGLAALPWRAHWGARDAVLERHGWRSTWEGDWDGRAAQRDELNLQWKLTGRPEAPLRLEVHRHGRLYFAELRSRGEQTLS